MPLDVPAGSIVFIDSTILHYAMVDFPPATAMCVGLLKRIASGELMGCITVPVLNDAVHKVMCSEARERFNQPRANLVPWMKANPQRVRELSQADKLLNLVNALPLSLVTTNTAALQEAQTFVRQFGLLASDALIAATLRGHGIAHLATNDDDFDGLLELTIWKPR